MLIKQNRLLKTKDFENVWKKGKGYFSQELGIKAVENKLPFSRFGFVVSLKISKSAVARNKIKRRLREIARKNLAQIALGYDFVFYTRPSIEKLKYADLEILVKNILRQIKKYV